MRLLASSLASPSSTNALGDSATGPAIVGGDGIRKALSPAEDRVTSIGAQDPAPICGISGLKFSMHRDGPREDLTLMWFAVMVYRKAIS
jgi:hypothetical protein